MRSKAIPRGGICPLVQSGERASCMQAGETAHVNIVVPASGTPFSINYYGSPESEDDGIPFDMHVVKKLISTSLANCNEPDCRHECWVYPNYDDAIASGLTQKHEMLDIEEGFTAMDDEPTYSMVQEADEHYDTPRFKNPFGGMD